MKKFFRSISRSKSTNSKTDLLAGDVINAKKQNVSLESPYLSNGVSNGRLPAVSSSHANNTEPSIIQSRTDFSGNSPKRYTTTCYFKSRTVPAWYTESLLLYIGSTKRKYNEKVWFKHKLQPYYWSENMTTEMNIPPAKPYISEVVIPREDSDIHYMSLELQQLAASIS